MKRPYYLLFLALLAAAAMPAFARAPERTPSFVEESDSFRMRAIEDDRGGFYALWTHRTPDNTIAVVGQHIDPKGMPLWQRPGTVLAPGLQSVQDWDAFTDGKGTITIVWLSNGRPKAQRWTGEGRALWTGNSITNSSTTAVHPTGVADAGGGAYIIWSEMRYEKRSVLIAQHVDSAGALVWPVDGTRVSLRPTDQRSPRVVYDGQAGVVIAWQDRRENSSQVQAQRLDYQGNRVWGPEGVLVTAPAGEAGRAPLLAPLGDGGAVLAWTAPSSNRSRIMMQSIDGRGRFRWGAQGIGLSLGDWDEWNPWLEGDGRGSIWTGWEDYRNRTHWQVFLGNINGDAHVVWPGGEVPLAPILADQGRLNFVEDGRRGAFGVWVDNRAGQAGIYVQEVDASGRTLLGERGQTIAEGLNDPIRPEIVNLAPGRAAILYADRPKKNRWELYWAPIQGPSPAPLRTPAASSSSSTPSGQESFPQGVGEGQYP